MEYSIPPRTITLTRMKRGNSLWQSGETARKSPVSTAMVRTYRKYGSISTGYGAWFGRRYVAASVADTGLISSLG